VSLKNHILRSYKLSWLHSWACLSKLIWSAVLVSIISQGFPTLQLLPIQWLSASNVNHLIIVAYLTSVLIVAIVCWWSLVCNWAFGIVFTLHRRQINLSYGWQEKRIYELKTKNQELEKFKFVLNYRIKELEKELEPKEKELKEMKVQISEVVSFNSVLIVLFLCCHFWKFLQLSFLSNSIFVLLIASNQWSNILHSSCSQLIVIIMSLVQVSK